MLVKNSKFREIAKYMTFMKMTEQIAKLSPDPKHQVGSLLIKKDFTNIISVGYNGSNPGLPNERESLEAGKSGFRHAEENCLLKANVHDPKDYMLFCTLSPCSDCAGRIAIKGIDTVIYKTKYVNEDGIQMLYRCHIKPLDFFDLLQSKLKDTMYFGYMYDVKKFKWEELFDKHISDFGLTGSFDEMNTFNNTSYEAFNVKNENNNYNNTLFTEYFIKYVYSKI